MREPRSATILGKRWMIHWHALPDTWGSIEPSENHGKLFRLSAKLRHPDEQYELLDTLIHECIHCLPLDEDTVLRMAADITRLLKNFGYGRTDE